VLTDAHTLAGWQSLDRGEVTAAWDHYRRACDAARAAESPTLLALALAEQAVVLSDIGRTHDGATMSTHARDVAHGEALAADGQQVASLRAFAEAERLLPESAERLPDGPYLALDRIHLARWQGHSLATSAARSRHRAHGST
jgi:hypothetical protein